MSKQPEHWKYKNLKKFKKISNFCSMAEIMDLLYKPPRFYEDQSEIINLRHLEDHVSPPIYIKFLCYVTFVRSNLSLVPCYWLITQLQRVHQSRSQFSLCLSKIPPILKEFAKSVIWSTQNQTYLSLYKTTMVSIYTTFNSISTHCTHLQV